MIKAERPNHVELSEANQIFKEKGLVVCGARLVERDDVRGRTSWSSKKIRARGLFSQRISLKRRIAMINNAAKCESAAFKDSAVSP
jgi:hypothetical protein